MPEAAAEAGRRLAEELRASESRFRQLYSRTPAIMHSIDQAGRLVSVSDLWLSRLGYKREEVLGRRSVEFLTPASRRLAREKILPDFYRTGVTKEAPYQMVAKSGEIVDVLLSATSERDARGRVVRSFAVITDVTQRKREQQELARATAWFESMFESSPDGIVSTDADGRFLRVNKAFERLVGYSQKELLRRTFQDITPPEFHAVGARAIQRMAAGGDAAVHVKEYRRKDGTRVPVHVTGFAVKDKQGKIVGFAAIVGDMTEPRRLEKEIAETTAREQAKIGRDLHDSVGQTLTALSLGLKTLQRLLPPQGRGRREAARLESLASLSVQQVRDVARGLLPDELQAGDLGASLRTLSHGAREMFGVPCQVAVRGDTRLSDNSAAVQLYRIAQEALNNAAKHARPRTGVRISLDAGVRRLRLAVRDDGVGVPARRGSGRRGLGIEIMKHRAESLGGALSVRRAPGGGTEVVCECPRPGSPR